MKKSYLIIASAIVLVILIGACYLYLRSGKVEPESPAGTIGATPTPEIVNEEVKLPDSIAPLENKPDINPVDQTNPYKNVKTNPFE